MIKIKDRECYQYHKDTLENYEATKHLDVFNITENRAISIRDALLEYRRENNIFETGDKIIYPWIGNGICTYNSECIVKTPCIHATDAEVLAGHRLPPIESLNDKDIPPNTIVLER